MSRTVLMAAAVIAACGAFANEDSAESILIVDGAMKMRFLPVDGTSQLPIEFMSAGENREKLSPVTMPKFWIADRMVTEGEYTAIMGCDVREGRKADDILAEVEWEEVLEFCEMGYAPIAKAYENAGVFGEWVHIGDLPYEVQLDQHVGDTKFMIVMEGESLESANVPISSNTLVQVLRCDFTGDGRSDMVVEQFGNVGSDGYWYGFYMQQPDGTILVTGQKFYPKEDDGRGAAWRNVWLTPDGKIVRKGEITLRGADL